MICDVFIEISKDSNIKYEYDKELGGIRLDRVLNLQWSIQKITDIYQIH
jgi:inorganic pyrophosphatase